MNVTEKNQILDSIRQLIVGTEYEGHVFLVGGAVRDELMGVPVKDLDICVDLPDGGIRLAQYITRQQRTYHKGTNPQLFPAYGIARFTLMGLEHLSLECVQTRKERYENRDSRNPVTEFAPLREDCLRRDLTINALYRNISTGEVVDITGWGLDDMKNHIIRTPREPFITFDEDALRELRVIRFAARFGWQIEEGTLQGIKDNASRMSIITQDRITDELSRMLIGVYPSQALQLIKDTGLMQYVLPEWMPTNGNSEWEETLRLVQRVDARLSIRLAALCTALLSEKDVDMTKVLQRFNFPKDLIKQVLILLSCWQDLEDCNSLTDVQLRRLQYRWGENAPDIFSLLAAKADVYHGNQDLMAEIRLRNEQMQQEDTACFQVHPPVNGKDIMHVLGIAPGPAVKQYMNQALELYFENPHMTKDECLIALQKK